MMLNICANHYEAKTDRSKNAENLMALEDLIYRSDTRLYLKFADGGAACPDPTPAADVINGVVN